MIKAELQLILLRGASGVSCDASGVFIKVVERKSDRLVLQDECGSNHFTL